MTKPLRCSFCGKSTQDVKMMLMGPTRDPMPIEQIMTTMAYDLAEIEDAQAAEDRKLGRTPPMICDECLRYGMTLLEGRASPS